MKNILKKIWEFIKRHKKLFIFLLIVVILVVVVLNLVQRQKSSVSDDSYTTVTMETMDLDVEITGSGVIEPQNQYAITSMVQGDIETASFEEGDVVQEGDLMYQFSTEDAQSNVTNAKLSLKQTQQSYKDAKKTQQSSEDNLSLKSNVEGYISKLYVDKGDTISANTTIADVYDNSVMYLTVPFNNADVKKSWVGKKATVYVGDELTSISGTVTEIAPTTTSLSGNMVIRNIEIEVNNPGGINDSVTGTASVDGVDCNSEGTFAVKSQGTLVAGATGTIEKLNISAGQYLYKNQAYAVLEDASTTDQAASQKIQVESAQNQLDSAKRSLDDYSITAPISGTVITKNAKAGDTITTTYATPLAVIYDLSSVKFDMSVDELDVTKIEIGQEVRVTADALEGEEMTGHITNISLEGVSSNGVTDYPVTVQMDEVGNLLPGMNVDATIITDSVEDAECIPVDAVQRGNVVYVKDATELDSTDKEQNDQENTTTDSDTPEGFHSVQVQVGIGNESYVQILGGLTNDDLIYLPRQQGTDVMTMMGGMNGGMNSAPAGMGGAPAGTVE